jgi:FAD/FMN-containing dehydrogenase
MSGFKKHLNLRRYLRGFFISLGILVIGVLIAFGNVVLSTRGNPLSDKLAREHIRTEHTIVNDVTEINPIQTQGIIVPHSNNDIIQAVKTHNKVSIGGGRNSMGGQTASESAIQLDMREFKQVLSFSTSSKEITVQTGATWHDVQQYIDPYNLSVEIMQTYSNFTVGGSLSVNVHGRYVAQGPIILSVKSIRIVLADGSLVEASPTQNTDIFYNAIGGMGGIGVITDATLFLTDNVAVQRSREIVPAAKYPDYFKTHVLGDTNILFHNGDLYPPDFNTVSAVSWAVTNKKPTTIDRLIPKSQDYWKERTAWVIMSTWSFGPRMREYFLEPWIYRDTEVHTRNYEASYDIAELEPKNRNASTYVLQEYFVPVQNFNAWVPKMKKVFTDNNVNVLNVSVRFAHTDPGATLAWARGDTFAFVVYYKQGVDQKAKEGVSKWTKEMIDAVLSVNGTYYLPYQLQATDEQFQRAYPNAIQYFEIKKQYDPTDKFTNKLWDTYYSPEKLETFANLSKEVTFASTTPNYYRKFYNSPLSIPEWYIVYSADEYARTLTDSLPSNFPYFHANQIYWNQFNSVTSMAGSEAGAKDAITVLNIIGYSFSFENLIKGIYENSCGKISEWSAGGVAVPEDIYAASVAQKYASFIYDNPWYDFSYKSAFVGLWNVKSSEDVPLRQWPRRLERKLILSLEYGIKTIYAKIISYATHTKFGVQNDSISATISNDGGATYQMLQARHYQPFTRILLATLDEQKNNPQFKILNIAGNKNIVLTYRDSSGAAPASGTTEVLRAAEVQGIVAGVPQLQDRITVMLAVSNIPQVYAMLKARGVTIDHFYDY